MLFYFSLFALVMLLPVMLYVGGKLGIKEGTRLKLAALIMLGGWVGLNAFYLLAPTFPCAMLMGILYLLSILIVAFMFWSVLCWGYTLSMLLILANHHSVGSLEQWKAYYAGPGGTRTITIDRVGVLVKLKFVRCDDDRLQLTLLGRLGGCIIKMMNSILGIKV